MTAAHQLPGEDLRDLIERFFPRTIVQASIGASCKMAWWACWTLDDGNGTQCRPRQIQTTLNCLAAAIGRTKGSEAENALRGLQEAGLIHFHKFRCGQVGIEIYDPYEWRLVAPVRDDAQRELPLPKDPSESTEVADVVPITTQSFDRCGRFLSLVATVKKAIRGQDGFEAWHAPAYAMLVHCGLLSEADLMHALGSGPSADRRGKLRVCNPGGYSRGAVMRAVAKDGDACIRAGLPQWPDGTFKLWDKKQLAGLLRDVGVPAECNAEWDIRPL